MFLYCSLFFLKIILFEVFILSEIVPFDLKPAFYIRILFAVECTHIFFLFNKLFDLAFQVVVLHVSENDALGNVCPKGYVFIHNAGEFFFLYSILNQSTHHIVACGSDEE